MAKRRPRFPPEPPDPLPEYREWTDHSYNPGYWPSVGKTPPTLKNLWSTKDRRWLGMLYVAAPVIGAIFALRRGVMPTRDQLLIASLVAGICLALGLVMLFSRDGAKTRLKKP